MQRRRMRMTDALRRMQAATSARGVYLVAADGTVLLGSGPPLTAARRSTKRQGAPRAPAKSCRSTCPAICRPVSRSGTCISAMSCRSGSPGRPGRAVPAWCCSIMTRPAPCSAVAGRLARGRPTGREPAGARWPPNRVVLVRPHNARPGDLGSPLATGDDMVTASAPVAGLPWRVVARLDAADAVGGLRRLMLLSGIGRMVILAAALGAFALLWQRLRLRAALAEIGHASQLLLAEAALPRHLRPGRGRHRPYRARWPPPSGQPARLQHDRLQPGGIARPAGAGLWWSRSSAMTSSPGCAAWPWARSSPTPPTAAMPAPTAGSWTCRSPSRWSTTAAEPPYFLVVAQDIGPRKQAEAELRRLTEELEARVHAEVAAREAAQARAAHAERMQALGQLAGGIAHDFNNVLQAVEGAASLIERRPGDEAGVRRLARLAIEAADRGASITRRLLAFGRRSDLRAEAARCRRRCWTACAKSWRIPWAPPSRCRSGCRPDLPPLLADKGQLETALVNLATNARDAMPEGGRLTLSAETEIVAAAEAATRPGSPPGGYVRLTVDRYRLGMDAATLARASEPFFTTKAAGRRHRPRPADGQGLRRAVRRRAGIESSPGNGTTVTLWLPGLLAGRSLPARSAACRPQPPSAVTRRRRRRPACCWSTTRTWCGDARRAPGGRRLRRAGRRQRHRGARAAGGRGGGGRAGHRPLHAGHGRPCRHPRRAGAPPRPACGAADRLCRRRRRRWRSAGPSRRRSRCSASR